MKTIFLFSGTKEGRMISEALSNAFIFHTVFVATEYGKMVMEPSYYAVVNEGRLFPEDMKNLFTDARPDIVIDATHPYATEVTKNIKTACIGLDIEYIRVLRNIDFEGLTEDKISVVKDVEGAIEKLKLSEGNILLTTGVKSLPSYVGDVHLKDRIYARILPSMESLAIALDTKIKPGHIIAQEGPFTVESNEALISQYNIKVLVTKNSGETGGFKEKLIAAANKGIEAIVIDKETEDEGLSLQETIKLLTGKEYKKDTVVIAGIGVGDISQLTMATKEAIEKADLIIGANRMVEFAKTINPGANFVAEYEPGKILKALETYKAYHPVVLMSGDTGFHSGAGKAKEALEGAGYEVKVLPGVSSVSYFASLIGWEYSEARLLSLHGNDADLTKIADEKNSFFAILAGPGDIDRVRKVLTDEWEVAVGFNLGYKDQEVSISSVGGIKTYNEKGLYILAARFAK